MITYFKTWTTLNQRSSHIVKSSYILLRSSSKSKSDEGEFIQGAHNLHFNLTHSLKIQTLQLYKLCMGGSKNTV